MTEPTPMTPQDIAAAVKLAVRTVNFCAIEGMQANFTAGHTLDLANALIALDKQVG